MGSNPTTRANSSVAQRQSGWLLAKGAGTKEFLSEDKKVIHKVETIVKVEKETVYVDKLVDYYDTGIPNYVIDHLKGYSEEELELLYQTRLIPFSKMTRKKLKPKKLVKQNIF